MYDPIDNPRYGNSFDPTFIPPERIENFLSNNPTFKVETNQLFKRAWELFQANIGEMIGFSLILLILYVLMGILSCLGFLLIFVMPHFGAGYLTYFYKYKAYKGAEFGDFFGAFSEYGGILGNYFIAMCIPILGLIFFGVIMGVTGFDPDNLESTQETIFVIGAVVFGILIQILMHTKFFFAPFFILFSKMPLGRAISLSWKASAGRNLRPVLWMVTISMIVFIVGYCLICLGLIVALPISYGIYFAFFEKEIMDKLQPVDETDDLLDHLI